MNAQRTLFNFIQLVTVLAVPACGGKAPAPTYGGYSGGDAVASEPMAEEDSGGDGEGESPAAKSAPADAGGPGPSTGLVPQPQRDSRPGLATQFGETRHSRVSTAPFVRADSQSPFAVSSLFYNDPEGIAAMSDSRGGGREHVRRFPIGAGHVEIGLRDEDGRFLTGFESGGNNYVAGVAGDRYTIFIRNHGPGRIEAVVSVDGLDVIDGKDASFSKRGYLLDPFGDLEIEGWRTSTTEVAAFRFGSVKQSYANRKHGDTRNVGVVGVALFHERGDDPRFWASSRSHGETRERLDANPFPQQFAAP